MPLGAFKAALMGTAGVSKADVVLIQSQTASDSATISFTSGIDSTYGEYIFGFYNINPETSGAEFTFQVNATDGADYNDSNITSTWFNSQQQEDASNAQIGYQGGLDLAQSTSFMNLMYAMGTESDESGAGVMHLFNPASTTYVKHFYARTQVYTQNDQAHDNFIGGYINDTTAIDDIQFKMDSGNFNGKIKLWGVK